MLCKWQNETVVTVDGRQKIFACSWLLETLDMVRRTLILILTWIHNPYSKTLWNLRPAVLVVRYRALGEAFWKCTFWVVIYMMMYVAVMTYVQSLIRVFFCREVWWLLWTLAVQHHPKSKMLTSPRCWNQNLHKNLIWKVTARILVLLLTQWNQNAPAGFGLHKNKVKIKMKKSNHLYHGRTARYTPVQKTI